MKTVKGGGTRPLLGIAWNMQHVDGKERKQTRCNYIELKERERSKDKKCPC